MIRPFVLKSWRRSALTLSAVLLVLTLAAAAARGTLAGAPDEAAQFVRGFGDEAIAMLSDPALSPDEREREFRQLLTEGFHLEVIARFVLGRHWRRADEAEREEFGRLFEDYVVAAYARQLGDYAGQELKVGVGRPQSDRIALVDSHITRSQGEALKVQWRLRRYDGGWRIIDVVVEGVSMAVTYRSEFSAVISSHGGQIAGLLEVLRTKTADQQASAAPVTGTL